MNTNQIHVTGKMKSRKQTKHSFGQKRIQHPLLPLQALHSTEVHLQICRQNTHTRKIKRISKIFLRKEKASYS